MLLLTYLTVKRKKIFCSCRFLLASCPRCQLQQQNINWGSNVMLRRPGYRNRLEERRFGSHPAWFKCNRHLQVCVHALIWSIILITWLAGRHVLLQLLSRNCQLVVHLLAIFVPLSSVLLWLCVHHLSASSCLYVHTRKCMKREHRRLWGQVMQTFLFLLHFYTLSYFDVFS